LTIVIDFNKPAFCNEIVTALVFLLKFLFVKVLAFIAYLQVLENIDTLSPSLSSEQE
jgi:hypothetical protein